MLDPGCFEEPYKMHLRTVCLEAEMKKHVSIGFCPSWVKSGLKVMTFLQMHGFGLQIHEYGVDNCVPLSLGWH